MLKRMKKNVAIATFFFILLLLMLKLQQSISKLLIYQK